MDSSSPITLDFVTSLHSSLHRLDPSFPFPSQDPSSLPLYLTTTCTHLVQMLEQQQEQSGLNKLVRTLQAERRKLEEENEELRDEVERLQRDSEDEETENGDNLTRLLMVNVLKKTLESKELIFEQKEREMKRTISEKEEEVRSVSAALALEISNNIKPQVCDTAFQTVSVPVKHSEVQIDTVTLCPQATQTQAIGEAKDCQTDPEPEQMHRDTQTQLRQSEREMQTDKALGCISTLTQTEKMGECEPKEVQTDQSLGKMQMETQTYSLAEYCCREMQTESGGRMVQAEVQATAVLASAETQAGRLETKENAVQTNANIWQIHPKAIDLTLKAEEIVRNSIEMQTESPDQSWEAFPDPSLCATEAYVQTQPDLESQWIQTEATEERQALVQTSLDLPDLLGLPETASIALQTEALQGEMSKFAQTVVAGWEGKDVEVQVKPSTTAQRTGTERESIMRFVATQTEPKGDNCWTQTVITARRDAETQFRPKILEKQTETDIYRERTHPEMLPESLSSPKQVQKSYLLLKPAPKTKRNFAAQTPSQDPAQPAFSLQSLTLPAPQWPTSLPLSPKDPGIGFPMGASPRDANERIIMLQKTLNKSESSDLSTWEAQLQAKESTLLSLTQQLRQRERVTLEREQRQRRRKLFEAGAVTQLYPAVQRRETEKSLTER